MSVLTSRSRGAVEKRNQRRAGFLVDDNNGSDNDDVLRLSGDNNTLGCGSTTALGNILLLNQACHDWP